MQHSCQWRFQEANEPLRRAYVFSKHLLGDDKERTNSLWQAREKALDQAVYQSCRFRPGDSVAIIAGDHCGKTGKIEKILTRCTTPYVIKLDESDETIHIIDDDIDEVPKQQSNRI